MSMQMERRIRRAEEAAATRKPAERQPKMMFFPVNGDASAKARYCAEVDQAVRDGFFVIGIVPLQPMVQA